MTYQSLYRKYRPKHLDEVVGQKHILNVLNNSLKKDMISHAYLFCGPRGTGKTSIAKLMAQSINCEVAGEVACKTCANCLEGAAGTHPDIVEIDAASNNGVEEIRSLIEKVKYTPILGKYKVYIIDEVHMLSQGAFNAFLKTLEEPPEHAVFILATTEIHKVLPTIISRCQRFDFTNINERDIANRLDFVLEQEHAKAETGVTELIASLSSGALRNALTILEQAIIIADGEIKLSEIYETNGVVTADQKIELFKSLELESMETLSEHIEKLNENVISVERLMMDLVKGLKDSVVYAYTKDEQMMTYFDVPFIKYLDETYTVQQRMSRVDVILSYIDKMKFSQNQATYMELALIALFNLDTVVSDNVPRETKSIEDFVKETFETQKPEPIIEKEETIAIEIPKGLEPLVDIVEEIIPTPLRVEPVEEESLTANLDLFDEVFEEEVNHEEEDVSRETYEEPENTPLSHLDLVQFMVSADKEQRIKDVEAFSTVSRYRTDLKYARPSRLLDGASLVLSGDQFVVLAFNTEFEALELMEPRNRSESLDFSEVLYQARKHVYATTNSDFADAVQLFRTLSEQKSLPEALSAADFKEVTSEVAKKTVDESLEKVKDLFGDHVVIETKE